MKKIPILFLLLFSVFATAQTPATVNNQTTYFQNVDECLDCDSIAVFGEDGKLQFRNVEIPLVHEQTITATEITNSFTTPVEVIPDPGLGKIIVITNVVALMDFQTTAYDSNRMFLGYDDVTILEFSSLFCTSTADFYENRLPLSSLISNSSVDFSFRTAAPTQGDGILKLKIYYRIVEF